MTTHRTFVAVCTFVLIFSISALLNQHISYRQYTLYSNGHWQSGKTKLEKGVIGSWATLYTKPALSQNQLNISAWHGYQQFTYKQALPLKSISFTCKSHNSPFAFILHYTDSGSVGILFNYNNKGDCFLYNANQEGGFTSRQKFAIKSLFQKKPNNQIAITRYGDSIWVKVDDRSFFAGTANLDERLCIGFKGNTQTVYVDNLKAIDTQGTELINESFAPGLQFQLPAAVVFIGLLLLWFVLSKQNGLNFILLLIPLLIGLIVYQAIYFYRLSALYPPSFDSSKWPGVKWDIEGEEQILKRITAQNPIDSIAGKVPVILCLGSSQTWGAGATKSDYTYPARLQQSLRATLADSTLLVINCGISGSQAWRLFEIYKTNWVKYQPVLTVIDLSANDMGNYASFEKNIKKFIAYNTTHQIKTVLVAEPNDTSSAPLRQCHQILQQEAGNNRILLIQPQYYMDSCALSGFLWWDYVHPTDFGYDLLTQVLAPGISAAIKRDSLLIKFKKTVLNNPI